MTERVTDNEESEEPGNTPAGTGCTGRCGNLTGRERRQTVKAKKSRGGAGSGKRSKKAKTRKPPGRNVNSGVTEAKRILKELGYIVGRVDDRDTPYDLIAQRGGENLSLRVLRPREPIMNASDVRHFHSKEVLELQPYWTSDADNIQLWIFSRVAGLLRYRVFRGGIWNVETMQNGWQEKHAGTPDPKTAKEEPSVQKSRTAPSPVRATGDG